MAVAQLGLGDAGQEPRLVQLRLGQPLGLPAGVFLALLDPAALGLPRFLDIVEEGRVEFVGPGDQYRFRLVELQARPQQQAGAILRIGFLPAALGPLQAAPCEIGCILGEQPLGAGPAGQQRFMCDTQPRLRRIALGDEQTHVGAQEGVDEASLPRTRSKRGKRCGSRDDTAAFAFVESEQPAQHPRDDWVINAVATEFCDHVVSAAGNRALQTEIHVAHHASAEGSTPR